MASGRRIPRTDDRGKGAGGHRERNLFQSRAQRQRQLLAACRCGSGAHLSLQATHGPRSAPSLHAVALSLFCVCFCCQLLQLFEDVDLSDDWTEYDDDANESVSIMNVKHEFRVHREKK